MNTSRSVQREGASASRALFRGDTSLARITNKLRAKQFWVIRWFRMSLNLYLHPGVILNTVMYKLKTKDQPKRFETCLQGISHWSALPKQLPLLTSHGRDFAVARYLIRFAEENSFLRVLVSFRLRSMVRVSPWSFNLLKNSGKRENVITRKQ